MVRITRRDAIIGAGASGLTALAGCTGNGDGNGDESNGGGNGNGSNDDGNGNDDDGGGQVGSIPTGWSESGSSGYLMGQVFATTLDQEAGISIDARGTGSAENMRLLDSGEIAMGYSNAYLYDMVMADRGSYSDKPVENKPAQAFGSMAANMFFIAHADAGVNTISDFAGNRVTIYTPSVSMYPAIKAGLQNAGVYGEMDERSVGVGSVPDAFVNQEIDVALVYNVAGDAVPPWLEELGSRMEDDEFKIVNPTEEEVQAVTDVNGISADPPTRPKLLYEEQEPPEIVRFNLMYGTYATRREDMLDKETMYDIMKTLYENREAIRDEATILQTFGSEQDMFDGYSIEEYSFHPGAAKLYKELGWWSDEYTEAELR